LKPIVPADDHEIALPCTSEIRILVLLNDEFTCATPAAMFLRSSARRSSVASGWAPAGSFSVTAPRVSGTR
jgi:hypothetical protein